MNTSSSFEWTLMRVYVIALAFCVALATGCGDSSADLPDTSVIVDEDAGDDDTDPGDADTPDADADPEDASDTDPPAPFCGDGACNGDETLATCAQDCPPACGDGACNGNENASTCANDCPATCGDSYCTHTENASACAADCTARCGDSACTHNENASTCANDCPATCGDAFCTHDEEALTCDEDCDAVCGDDLCSHNEDAWSCAQDCSPDFVTIKIRTALIGPVKSDGCQWDGLTCNAPEGDVATAIGSLLTGGLTIGAAVELYNSGVFNGLNKPDPYGWFEQGPLGDYLDSAQSQDTFFAPMHIMFEGVPYTPSLTIDGELYDSDLSNSDMIWSGMLRFQDIEAAFLAGEDTWIDLRGASQGQLTGILMSVEVGEEW